LGDEMNIWMKHIFKILCLLSTAIVMTSCATQISKINCEDTEQSENCKIATYKIKPSLNNDTEEKAITLSKEHCHAQSKLMKPNNLRNTSDYYGFYTWLNFSCVDEIIMSCSDTRMKPVPTQELLGDGFAVLPPKGTHWCLAVQNNLMVGFSTHKYIGKDISAITPKLEETTHSYGVAVYSLQTEKENISTMETLKNFVQRWLQQGEKSIEKDGIYHPDLSPASDFKHISSHVLVDYTMDSNCVRYNVELEQSKNPILPSGWIMTMLDEGFVCRHQDSETILIQITFSERFRKNWKEPDSAFGDKIQKEVKIFMDNFKFLPL
jgi:hypothetical protein